MPRIRVRKLRSSLALLEVYKAFDENYQQNKNQIKQKLLFTVVSWKERFRKEEK